METLEILPQKIFKFKCDPNLIKNTLINLKDEKWNNYERLSQTIDVRLNKNPKYLILYEWINKCLMEVKYKLNLQCTRMEITQSWANTLKKGDAMHSHSHPNSFMSGILYLTNSNASTIFSMDNIWINDHKNRSQTISLKYPGRIGNDILVSHKQPTIEGDLIIFPSNLFHTVDEHSVDEYDRYTISFNSFPTGHIGNMSDLQGLMIEVL